MAYATRDDLVTFSISSGALQRVSTDKQDDVLNAASRIADGYLNARYTLPLTGYGDDLKRAVCDIAAFMLMKARGFSPETADADMLMRGESTALKWLEGVSTGKISPIGIVDSSSQQINATDTDAAHGPFVVQVSETDAASQDEFWEGQAVTNGGSVGSPRRRGW